MKKETCLDTKQTIAPENIILEKELVYDQHTLPDEYLYKETSRCFQWNKIRKGLAFLDFHKP